jgi:hypothetical protein
VYWGRNEFIACCGFNKVAELVDGKFNESLRLQSANLIIDGSKGWFSM